MTVIFLCTHLSVKMGIIIVLLCYKEIYISMTHNLQIKPIFTVKILVCN